MSSLTPNLPNLVSDTNLRRTVWLSEGWQLARTPAGECASPDGLAGAMVGWREAKVPGTVASALHQDIDKPGNYDADDWWYRSTFALPAACTGTRHYLRFDGLATLAQVWLNGVPILSSRNMFVAQRVDVTGKLRDVNHLVICFASLEAAMAEKRPRPRWRTALVEQQNLRWFRTTLLGRMPGWTPAITPVGPWGPIALECIDRVEVASLNIQTRAEGTSGRVQVRAAVSRLDGKPLEGARLRVGDTVHALKVLNGHDARIHGEIAIPEVPLWWPHTHGFPRRVHCLLELNVDGQWLQVDCGSIGFKEISLDQRDGRVQFKVNGLPVFCRGAVWTAMDILALRTDPAALRHALELARDAGVNMLRVGGTMAYECEDFYRICDELGILVWQDFMFANMDYPVHDPEFRAEIEAEARHILDRLHRHPCIAAYCGGSEISQQAAMLGLPADEWSNQFFVEVLPRLCSSEHAAIPYFPSTPWGGALPFHVSTGISHYYGVGAYRRPLSDVKNARVKFTTECLGFSNVPEAKTMAMVFDGEIPPPHHPRWKARTPRDNGAGWDFEDIRDHYLKELFDRDPVALRSQEVERYYAMSRVVSGEVMARTFAEWRAPHSLCGGALVWTFQDIWPGAGWGIIDSTGQPKAAYWYLKRAWARRTVQFTDEGLDGLAVHVVNDSHQPLDATVELEMYREGRIPTGTAQTSFKIPARGAASRHVDALLGYFSDSTNAYRFGPPKHDVAVVRLKRSDTGEEIAEDFFFPLGMSLRMQHGAGVSTSAEWTPEGKVEVTVRSDVFLQAVAIACEGFTPDDNFFHLAPNRDKRIVFTPAWEGAPAFKAFLEPLNLAEPIAVRTTAAVCRPGRRDRGDGPAPNSPAAN
jgi:beta-mannosidase